MGDQVTHTREPRWLDYPGLAAYLGVDEEDLRDWVTGSRIPYHKIHGSQFIGFDRDEIDEWVRSGVVVEAEQVCFARRLRQQAEANTAILSLRLFAC